MGALAVYRSSSEQMKQPRQKENPPASLGVKDKVSGVSAIQQLESCFCT